MEMYGSINLYFLVIKKFAERKMRGPTWWMSMRITAASRHGELGKREKALACVRSSSPKAQYTEAADGMVKVKT